MEDCEELQPKSKEKWIFVNEKGGKEASDGVVCSSEPIAVYEVRKKQQHHEAARKIVKDQGGCVKTPNISKTIQRIWHLHLTN